MQRSMPVVLCMIALLLLTTITVAAEADDCIVLHYGKMHSWLKGKPVRRIFAGPPNYKSISKGDRKEAVWMLVLVQTLCVRPLSTDIETEEVNDIREIQLVFPNELQHYQMQHLSNNLVIATGSLFFGQSGHHHTKVLLDVTDIRSTLD